VTLRLNGSTSGYTEIDAPAVAGSNTLVLPTGNGSSGQYLQTNGSGALSWSTSGLPAQALTLGTTVASTSGTSIDFTGIPSTVKRVTVMFNGVSLSGNANGLVQLGAGSFETTGYLGGATVQYVGTIEAATATNGLLVPMAQAPRVCHGSLVLTSMGSNLWVSSGSFGFSNAAGSGTTGGSKTLSGTLDRVRITTVNGTDTFDAGSINILYEG
jgi:hypothetical protein